MLTVPTHFHPTDDSDDCHTRSLGKENTTICSYMLSVKSGPTQKKNYHILSSHTFSLLSFLPEVKLLREYVPQSLLCPSLAFATVVRSMARGIFRQWYLDFPPTLRSLLWFRTGLQ